ncbi:MAG TPA: cytochrome ubiquinol oxidase subunit I [Symbiobacteriaceae bacterium]|nr:cytochrome ubiquinol oxidase subunit I [Symbiobacteriaceae bacterium]
MSNLIAARITMGYTLAFHMIFAALGVAFPLLLVLANVAWLKTGKQEYLRLTKTWQKVVSVTFAIGAVTGTGLSFMLGLLWPSFMKLYGDTMGPAFQLEGFAFFIEAIFLGLYLYGWKRLSPGLHLFCGVMVGIGGAASAVLVQAANAWMQHPVNIALVQTNPAAVPPFTTLFLNPYYWYLTIHGTIGCFAATAFLVAGAYAWKLLKKPGSSLYQAGLKVALSVGICAAAVLPLSGHLYAQYLGKVQPAKLAAAEAHFVTGTNVPLLVGGFVDKEAGQVTGALKIPGGLSFLAHDDFSAEVTGLDKFPKEDWPNVTIVHYAFDIMVGCGMLILLAAVWYWGVVLFRKERLPRNLLRLLVVCFPLGIVAFEAGWMVTEIGRQPWIVYGVMRTRDAVTQNNALPVMWTYILVYGALMVATILILRRIRHVEVE